MPVLDLIRVRIVPDGLSALKITWEHKGLPFMPYSVDRDLLQRQADNVRKRLEKLAYQAIKRGSQFCGDALKLLAEAGANLGHALFTPTEPNPWPDIVRQWLDGLEGSYKMMFVLDERIQIPWGLVFDGNLNGISDSPEDVDINNFRDFWCLKYSVSAVYGRITPQALVRKKDGTSILLRVVNLDALKQASMKLDAKEKEAFDRLQQIFDHTVSSRKAFFEKWRDILDKPIILFFYSHASGTSLNLAENDKITIDDLRLHLSNYGEPRTERTALFVMNGCSTATGHSGGGFLEAAGSPPFCGFVGTESAIPDLFALRFGYNLLYELLVSGEAIWEIMDRLRELHWPLSLFYSVYCHPEYSFQWQKAGQAAPHFVSENFSEKHLGETLLSQEVSH